MFSAIGCLLCNLARLSKKVLIPLFSILTLLLSFNVLAANGPDNAGRIDYDLDDNGLIEINDLADLDEIRNNLDGKTLYSSNIGCPDAEDGTVNGGCIGFELTADLDFDTNGDGLVDEFDDYRNKNDLDIAEGWEPIGSGYSNYFGAIFNGNGYVIKNLTINRPQGYRIGLFGHIKNSVIENVVIAGANSEITGSNNVAALVGFLEDDSQIRNVLVVANVTGTRDVGGVVGYAVEGAEIENVFASGSVSGSRNVGGIVGRVSGDATSIKNILSTSFIVGESSGVGGLIGFSWSENISNSYWAKDSSGQDKSYRSSGDNSYVGLDLATLQCATAENTDSSSGCVSDDGGDEGLSATMILYKGWDPAIWDFGIAPNENQQLPGLKLNGKVFRDSDGDGSLDEDDKWPLNYAASIDKDGDDYPDSWSLGCGDACILASGLILDQFPHHSWAALDADFDGLPDGAENCVSDCQLDGLTKDSALGDYDNDGILDADDADENNDGINDVDADHNGLIDIDSLDMLNAMRFQLQGVGLQLTNASELEVSGCPFVIYQGVYQQRCSGYELTQDLDFDSNSDGIVDEYDDYRNINLEGAAEGWEPVGTSGSYFGAIFNGNGYVIKNLTINRPETNHIGLFGMVKNAVVENVVIAGSSSKVVGRNYVAALVGEAQENTQVRNAVITADVEGVDYVAGLAGQVKPVSYIENCFVSGSVSGDNYVAGLVGLSQGASDLKNSISQSFSISSISGKGYVGGLIAYHSTANITNSYWAKDISGQASSSGRSEANSYVGLTLAKLQCAIAENTDFTTGCVSEDGFGEDLNRPVILYKDWDPAIWDFGTAPNANEQLPALKINGRVIRDRDADEVLDAEDDFPLNLAAAIDDDNDGMPDFWNPRCDAQCQADSELVLDPFLNDTDNDGVENDFVPDEPPVVDLPVIEPPANPSSGEAASSGGSSGGGSMAWILLLLMTLAVVGQYRRYAKIEKNLF